MSSAPEAADRRTILRNFFLAPAIAVDLSRSFMLFHVLFAWKM